MVVPKHKGLINITCLEVVEGKAEMGLVLGNDRINLKVRFKGEQLDTPLSNL